MVKIAAITVSPAKEPWLYCVDYAWNKSIHTYIKENIPWKTYDIKERVWKFPVEMVDKCISVLEDNNLKCAFIPKEDVEVEYTPDPREYFYQTEAMIEAAKNNGRYIFAFETGLGKTFTAIRSIVTFWKDRKTTACVLVVPANAESHWITQLAKFLGEEFNDVDLLLNEEPQPNSITILSWGKLRHLETDTEIGFLLGDELHNAKGYKSKRGQQWAQVTAEMPIARPVIGLSATPIPNAPVDAYLVYNSIYPGRLGSFTGFTTQYIEITNNGYGNQYGGLIHENMEELNTRLDCMMGKASKQDPRIKALLPDVEIKILDVPNESNFDFKDISLVSESALEQYFNQYRSSKMDTLASLSIPKLVDSSKHLLIFTYRHEARQRLAVRLEDLRYEVFQVHGKQTVKAREKIIDRCSKSEGSIILASIEATAESIDTLGFVDTVVFAEYSWKPKTLVQAIGRFVRLSTLVDKVTMHFSIMKNTKDEKIVDALFNKVLNITRMVDAGTAETLLLDGFNTIPEGMTLADAFDGEIVDDEFDILNEFDLDDEGRDS